MRRLLGVLLTLMLVCSLAIGLSSQVKAATFTVNSTGDATDANPGDGVAETALGNGICTLRAAIQETNALAGPDTINLPAGTYTLNIAGTGEDAAATGDLDITDNLTISSADQTTTIIDGGALDRVLHIHSGSIVAIADVTLQNGQGVDDGGGLFNLGTLTLMNCAFLSNSAGWGGGIFNGQSSPMVTGCTFSNNSASNGGGGIYNYDNSSPTITKCIFSNNSATWGGGMQNSSDSSPTVTNCIFHNNTATSWGGGMNNDESSPTITNCTFSSNTASTGGNGISNGGSAPTVTNCILWNTGDEIANDVTSTPSINYSDIQGGYSGVGNIDANPLFVDAVGGNYYLKPGSPCIDAGTNVGAPTEDIKGNPRPIDGDGDSTATTDMGAYEYVPPSMVPTMTIWGGIVMAFVLGLLLVFMMRRRQRVPEVATTIKG